MESHMEPHVEGVAQRLEVVGEGFGPTVALPLLHLHCERGRGVQSVLMFMQRK